MSDNRNRLSFSCCWLQLDDKGKLIGILSESDLLWKGAGVPLDHTIIPPVSYRAPVGHAYCVACCHAGIVAQRWIVMIPTHTE